jgi:molybdopterin-synthase adenylyltransferase
MVPITIWRNSLFREIEAAGLLRQPRRITLADGAPALAGRITVAGKVIELVLDVEPIWHHHLPIITLRPWDALGFLPHIDPAGMICFLEQEGIVFDRRRPLDVVRESLSHVERTLREGLTGANQVDFVNEFEVYWQRLPERLVALADIDLPDVVTHVTVASSPNAQPPLRIGRNVHALRHGLGLPPKAGPWTVARGMVIPLEVGTMLVPPRSDRPFWSLTDIRQLLASCSAANRARLDELICGRTYNHTYVMFRLPRPVGGYALFGMRFAGVLGAHPLAQNGHARTITPIIIGRCDKPYLLQRGGGAIELIDKRVLLIGCGAVGGHIAWELARAGIAHLTLVDPDTLGLPNTYRHVLGRRYWGMNKAVALKQEIGAHLPFVQIQAIDTTIEVALATNQVDLSAYDLIISALGAPTTELDLNARVRGLSNGPSIIFTWLEPLGIGGHALLTGLNADAGCFECLYTALDGQDSALHNRASFAAPGQTFHRSLAGCDSSHTPYGSLDAVQTAHLATRLAIDVLLGHEHLHRLRSWKGDARAFTAANFRLAARYQLSQDALTEAETAFVSPTCPVCGAQRSNQD